MLLFAALAAAGEPECRRSLDAGALAAASEACSRCAAEDGPRARWCAGRVTWLAPRRGADGSFAAAEALERLRRGEGGRAEAAAIERDPGASATVRAEAALWLAAELRDAGELGAAEALLAQWQGQDGVASEVGRTLAVRLATVRAERADRQAATVAASALACWFAATAGAFRRGETRWEAPAAMALILLVGGVLLEAWERGAGRPMGWLAVGLLPVVGWAARGVTGVSARFRPVFRGAAGFAALAAGWLGAWKAGVAPWP